MYPCTWLEVSDKSVSSVCPQIENAQWSCGVEVSGGHCGGGEPGLLLWAEMLHH